MTIYKHFEKATRNKIVFYNEYPVKDAGTYLRGYVLERIDESDITNQNQLTQVAGVVFRQNSKKPNNIFHEMRQYANTLLDHDCRVFVVIAPVVPGSKTLPLRNTAIKTIQNLQLPISGLRPDELPPNTKLEEYVPQFLTPFIHVIGSPNCWREVDEFLRKYPPDNLPDPTFEIESVDESNRSVTITVEQSILIQRAFHDCQNVRLVSESGGRSDTDTYRVFANLKDDLVNDAPPFQYFVKIGTREQISKEYLANRELALEHIPFHLGPRLRLDRCALGAKQGIIVCDYVSGTEKLRDCAKSGRAVPVIASLFNTTLRTWREGAQQSDQPLQEYIKKRMPDQIPKQREKLINQIENVKELAELSKFLVKTPSTPVRVGVVHGDLHSLNVLVRGGDAIVIDFEKVESSFPILLDTASLEAGLFVDGFIGDQRNGRELLSSVERLYEKGVVVDHEFIQCDLSDASAWFYDCVKQIRMQAREIELKSGQYALTLAVELIKKGCKDLNTGSSKNSKRQGLHSDDTRALAYVLAQRILSLF